MIPDPMYKSNKYFVIADEFITTYVYRPIAWLIVRLVVKTPITANQVTLAGLVTGIIAGVFYYCGGQLNFVIGAMLFFLASLLDCADGPVARLRKKESEFGKVFEGVADYIVGIAVFAGFMINLHSQGKIENLWVSGLLIVIFVPLHNMGWDYARTQFSSIMVKGIYNPVGDFREFCKTHSELKYDEKPGIWKFFIHVYHLYMLAEQSFFSPTDPVAGNVVKHYDEKEKQEYLKSYSGIMRLWGWSGGKTHFTFLMICTLLGRADLVIPGIIIGFNILFVATLLIHKIHFYRFRNK